MGPPFFSGNILFYFPIANPPIPPPSPPLVSSDWMRDKLTVDYNVLVFTRFFHPSRSWQLLTKDIPNTILILRSVFAVGGSISELNGLGPRARSLCE